MMKHSVFILILLLGIVILPALAQDGDETVETSPGVVLLNTETIELTSSSNGDYVLMVSLPKGYTVSRAQDQSYPVLYLLDPDVSFGIAANYSLLLSPTELSDIIIVGIGYPTNDVGIYLERRGFDYNSRADDFITFISEELLPLIDSTYRTLPGERAIAGHSLGGQIVLQIFATQTGLFNKYIAISPNIPRGIDEISADNDEGFRARIAGRQIHLFLAAAADEAARGSITEIVEALDAGDYDEIEKTVFVVEDETHLSVMATALTRGMNVMFSP